MKRFALFLLLAGLLCQTQPVYAAGFLIAEQSVSSLGTANAANTSAVTDATTAFSNPAGMPLLDYCNEVVSGIFSIIPHTKYHDKGTINVLGQPFPDSSNGGDGGSLAYVPDMAYVKRVGCRGAIGFAVNGLFGLVTDWNDRWYGRYYATRSAIESINFNPSVAYRITDSLSVGAGFNAMYFHAEFKNMVDFGLISFIATSGGLGIPEQQDGEAKLKGNTWGFGGNVGVLYQLGCNTRIGAQWRSQVRINLDKASIKYKDVPALLQPVFFNQKAQGKITLPDVVSFGIWHKFNNCLALMADFQWTHWKLLRELKIRFPNANQLASSPLNDSIIPLSWKDAWRYAVGATYDWNCNLTLRAGYAFDESPTPNNVLRSPRLPDQDRNWLATGFQYRLNECTAIDFSYAYIWVKKATINRVDDVQTNPDFSTGGGLFGNFKGYVNIVGLSFKARF